MRTSRSGPPVVVPASAGGSLRSVAGRSALGVGAALGLAVLVTPAPAHSGSEAVATAMTLYGSPDTQFVSQLVPPVAAYRRFVTEPGDIEAPYAFAEALAAVDRGSNGPVSLRALAVGDLRNHNQFTGVGAAATAYFRDWLTVRHDGTGPAQGLLTLRMALDAEVGIAGNAMMLDLARFVFVLSHFGARALLELQTTTAGHSGPGAMNLIVDQRWYQKGPDRITLSDRYDDFIGASAFGYYGYHFDMILPFTFGQPFDILWSITCQTAATNNPIRQISAARSFCNAGNSLDVLRIASVTDFDGRPVRGARVLSLAGLDYRLPVAGVIPEPLTWVMMIAGFGLVGTGLRLRRLRAGAAGSLAPAVA